MTRLFSGIIMTGIVAASAMFAASFDEITVTLPHPVTVGAMTLPVGTYKLSPMAMTDGGEYFIVRGEKTAPIVISAQKSESFATAKDTRVSFSETGNSWHFDRLTVQGDSTSYELGQN